MNDDALREALPVNKDDIIRLAEDLLTDSLLDAVGTVVHIAKHADNERLRFTAASFIIDRKLPRPNGAISKEDWAETFKRAGITVD